MNTISAYERLQIESMLQREQPTSISRGVAVVLLPDSVDALLLHDTAILPALRQCDLNGAGIVRVFNSDSWIRVVVREVLSAEVVLADLSQESAHLYYVIGLCHALGRCPLLLTRDSSRLPFNLASLRFVEYEDTPDGRLKLRDNLGRAVRVFLAASRTGG
jgi:hypothetical protein